MILNTTVYSYSIFSRVLPGSNTMNEMLEQIISRKDTWLGRQRHFQH